ncbi:corticotropin-releasing factor receptor 2-like [Hydractinia symbiolongicarpus]|uniref:corticotropin-releasing factor receptor 2-like n=1 Tax=Hydractinia symbiolongicarpus TaxID=13093 RepID=UPI0025515DF0|nr:corticotropin-releasing factor receptor 2-like [Hydractinia symbiolongicarpus]
MANESILIGLIFLTLIANANAALTLGELMRLSDRLKAECFKKHAQAQRNNVGCATSFDSFFGCWPPTPKNSTAKGPCNNLLFDERDMVDRKCDVNGKWETVDYALKCKPLSREESERRRKAFLIGHKVSTAEEIDRVKKFYDVHRLLLWTIRSLDAIVCIVSVALILWLIPLKNSRFLLHLFLIIAIMLHDILQLVLLFPEVTPFACTIIGFFVDYTLQVTVFMMFCQGLYQFRQFYFVFITKKRLPAYIAFAYITPLIIVFGIYVPLILNDPPIKDYIICYQFMDPRKFFLVIYGPIIFLLIVNIGILAFLMKLIISKLKTDRTSELLKMKKAARGLIILLMLLGLFYGLSIYGTGLYDWWHLTRIVLVTTQGLLICGSQVFISKQVQKALKRRVNRFLVNRKICKSKAPCHKGGQSGSFNGYDNAKRTSTASTLTLVSLCKGGWRKKKKTEEKKRRSEDFNYIPNPVTSTSIAKSEIMADVTSAVEVEAQIISSHQAVYLHVVESGVNEDDRKHTDVQAEKCHVNEGFELEEKNINEGDYQNTKVSDEENVAKSENGGPPDGV